MQQEWVIRFAELRRVGHILFVIGGRVLQDLARPGLCLRLEPIHQLLAGEVRLFLCHRGKQCVTVRINHSAGNELVQSAVDFPLHLAAHTLGGVHDLARRVAGQHSALVEQ